MRRHGSILLACLALLGAGHAGAGELPAVTDALRATVKSLSRPTFTYHYAIRHRLQLPEGYVAPDIAAQRSYLLMKVGRYWDLGLPVNPYATASGLYVGTDPIIPRAFGGVGDVWSMIELVLPVGFRYVDVRRRDDRPAAEQKFAPEVVAQLARAGCDAEYPETLVIGLESAPCREIAVRALRALDVDGILYRFQRTRFRACGERPEGGFIVLKPASIAVDTRLFTAESAPDAALADRLRIRELFRLAREAGSRREIPWPDLPGGPARDEVVAWMHTHLFGCGDYPEDRLPEASALKSSARRR
jgi:hypothetical protein